METENISSQRTAPEETGAEKAVIERRRSVRKRRVAIFIIISLLNAGLLALLWTQLLTPAQPGSNSGGNNATDPLVGHSAPNFTLPVLSTHSVPPVQLAGLKGKPIVLNFWASWCDPCKHEAPLLQKTWLRVEHQGVLFIGISYQDTQSDGLHFLQQYGITYTNVLDSNGSTAINYGVTGVPETFFINRQGVIVRRVIGELSEKTIRSNLALL